VNQFRSLYSNQGIWTRHLDIYPDHRGKFLEICRFQELDYLGITFAQSSYSYSTRDVVRGLHSQINQWQLITLLKGSLAQFLLDTNLKSDNSNYKTILELDADKLNQVLIAPGVYHGYHVTSDDAMISYHTSTIYQEELERRIDLIGTFQDCYLFPNDIVISKLDRDASWRQD